MLRKYLKALRGNCERELAGPCAGRGHFTRGACSLVPAARPIDEHGCSKLRRWMRSPAAELLTPEAALDEAQEAARAARLSEQKLRSQLKALQGNMTAEIAARRAARRSRRGEGTSHPHSNPSRRHARCSSRALPPFSAHVGASVRPLQVRRQVANDYGAEGSDLVEKARRRRIEREKKNEARLDSACFPDSAASKIISSTL